MTDDEIIHMLRINSQQASPRANGQLNQYPPATDQEIDEAENALGFALPALLKRIYLEIGNGGCRLGPMQGIYGVARGYRNPLNENMVELTAALARENTWWENFAVVGEGGCGVFYCIDCDDSDFPVYCYNGDLILSEIDDELTEDEPPTWGWDVQWETLQEWLVEPNFLVT